MINTIGTGNVLNACRDLPIEAILMITTDKVYKDQKGYWPYRETDELGAADPYSTSKACAELVIDCYRESFLSNVPLASARAGNCVGGGDWGYRVIPMIMDALMKDEAPPIWDPYAMRPWQSVLDCLSGYLRLIEYAYENPMGYNGAWNFGPSPDECYTVGEIAKRLCELWDSTIKFNYVECPIRYNLNVDLRLDSSKARKVLNWKPKWTLDDILENLVEWYLGYQNLINIRGLCELTLERYENKC
jgi:CDP-glucose 4,6-dehydratase